MSQLFECFHCLIPIIHKKNDNRTSDISLSPFNADVTSELEENQQNAASENSESARRSSSVGGVSTLSNDSLSASHDASMSASRDVSMTSSNDASMMLARDQSTSNLSDGIKESSAVDTQTNSTNDEILSSELAHLIPIDDNDDDGYIPLEKCSSGRNPFPLASQAQPILQIIQQNDASLLGKVPPSPCNHKYVSLQDSLPVLPTKRHHRILGNSHSISGHESRFSPVIPHRERIYHNNSPLLSARKTETFDADRQNNNVSLFRNTCSNAPPAYPDRSLQPNRMFNSHEDSADLYQNTHHPSHTNGASRSINLGTHVILEENSNKSKLESNCYYNLSESHELLFASPPALPAKAPRPYYNLESSEARPPPLQSRSHFSLPQKISYNYNNFAGPATDFNSQSIIAVPIRKRSENSSSDEDVSSSNSSTSNSFSSRPKPPTSISSEVKYLQLDLNQLSQAGKNPPRQPQISCDDSNYREIDWCKTRALIETKNNRSKIIATTVSQNNNIS